MIKKAVIATLVICGAFFSGALYAYSDMDNYGELRYRQGRTSLWEELSGYLGRGYYVVMGDILVTPSQRRSLTAKDVCTNCHLQGPPSY